MKKKLALILALILASQILILGVSADTTDTYQEAISIERAMGRLNHVIKPNSSIMTEGFTLEPGDLVTINLAYTPRNAVINYGLIMPDGVFRYWTGSDGVISQTIRVNETGKYHVAINNKSSFEAEVTGYVYY